MEELKIYLAKYFSADSPVDGVAVIAANSSEEAEKLLNTTGDLKDYRIHITEMVRLPGSTYCGEPVVIKEYKFHKQDL